MSSNIEPKPICLILPLLSKKVLNSEHSSPQLQIHAFLCALAFDDGGVKNGAEGNIIFCCERLPCVLGKYRKFVVYVVAVVNGFKLIDI